MIRSDFHTHTNWVDGKHTPEEMVQSAIAQGMKTIGISEHCYTPYDPECCLSLQQTQQYQTEMARLKTKYASQIQVLCGIEMDATSQDDPNAYDYVIGSAHYLVVDGVTYPLDFSAEKTMECVNRAFGGDMDGYAEAYFQQVEHVVQTSKAHIIGHFDLITKFCEQGVGPDTTSPRYIAAWQSAMQNLVGKAVLEINTGAISRGYRTTPYPALDMLTYWHSLGGEAMINSDSHHKQTLTYAFDVALSLAKQAGYTRLGFTDGNGVFHQQLGE